MSALSGHYQPEPEHHEADEWRAQAACRGESADVFFGEDGRHVEQAKLVCARCPVVGPCLDFAISTGEGFGVWGGKSVKERRIIRRRQRPRRIPDPPVSQTFSERQRVRHRPPSDYV